MRQQVTPWCGSANVYRLQDTSWHLSGMIITHVQASCGYIITGLSVRAYICIWVPVIWRTSAFLKFVLVDFLKDKTVPGMKTRVTQCSALSIILGLLLAKPTYPTPLQLYGQAVREVL